MNASLFLLFQGLLIVLVVALLFCIYRGLDFALRRQEWKDGKRKQLLLYVMLGIICWLLFLAGMASIGFFADFMVLPPRLLLAFLPPFLLILYLTFSKAFVRFLQQIPARWLISVQSFRIAMELILWLGFLAGAVPFQMTFEGFNYDIVVGITALMAAPLFFGGKRWLRFESIIWNISGLVLLVNIVFISAVSTPSPLRIFFNEPANWMISDFPFIWIPGFIVPFALAMHLFSIRQMLYGKSSA